MNSLTVSLVAIMIPGVIMALIYDTYTQHKPWDSFKYILMSIVFGITTYLVMQAGITLYQLVTGLSDTKSIQWHLLSVWTIANGEDKLRINPVEILWGGLISIPVGLSSVYISTRRSMHEYLLRKGISNKYGDDNVFIRSIEEMCKFSPHFPDVYVYVGDEKRIVHGVVQFFNENDKSQEIGLRNATVYDAEDSTILFKTNFLYLSKEYGKMMLFKNYLEIENDENTQ